VGAYRDAGYDFLCLSDHLEEEYGWRITDTRPFRGENFTTILGAELSSAPWDDRDCYWVTAAGLPLDFETPPPDDHAEAIQRATDLGAFVLMLHPGLNDLPLAAVGGLPRLDAVEVYNHNAAMAATSDRAYGAYMLDGLLERGRKLLVNAGDDAHFGHPLDRFGGWVEVYCDRLGPDALVESLKAGRYYSTQGPALREMLVDGDRLRVASSDAYAISLTGGGDRWQSGEVRTGEPSVPIRRRSLTWPRSTDRIAESRWSTRLGNAPGAIRSGRKAGCWSAVHPEHRSSTRRVERWPVSARTGPIAGGALSEKTRVDQPPTPFAVVERGVK
jgi:hypothetical protein